MDGLGLEEDGRLSVLRAIQACEAFINVFRPLGVGNLKMTDNRADLVIAEIEDLAVLLKQTGASLRELCHG
jgi:hypothetical protein